MKLPTKLDRGFTVLLLFTLLIAVGTGCATNGRRFLLKEFQPTGPSSPDQPLKGVTVYLQPFNCATNLTSPDPTSKPEQPAQFTFANWTPQEVKKWDDESKSLEKTTPKEQMHQIGDVRDGFGIVMSHVYALNDPGKWLTDTLKMDLANLGAKVVDTPEAADLRVGGTLQFCRVDIAIKIWGDLVVDLELQPKNGAASHHVLHTNGGNVAWIGSTLEFYTPLRESRQKFSWLTINEIRKALNR